jgi:hypothetical protein
MGSLQAVIVFAKKLSLPWNVIPAAKPNNATTANITITTIAGLFDIHDLLFVVVSSFAATSGSGSMSRILAEDILLFWYPQNKGDIYSNAVAPTDTMTQYKQCLKRLNCGIALLR